jgi:hypothetical protein
MTTPARRRMEKDSFLESELVEVSMYMGFARNGPGLPGASGPGYRNVASLKRIALWATSR